MYNIVLDHGETMALNGRSLSICFGLSLLLLILFLHCISNISYHDIGKYQSSAQQTRRTGQCFLRKYCVISWSRYGLKRVLPWNFLFFISILLISCLLNGSKKTYHGKSKINCFYKT